VLAGGQNGGARTLTLTTPIDAHGEALSALTFRPLTVEDFDRVGYPIRMGGDGTYEPIPDRISELISRLAAIPRSSVTQMSVADWHDALGLIVSFFGIAAPTS
jgi:hypothetical protein